MIALPLDYLQALFLLAVRHTTLLWVTPAFNLRSLPVPVRLALGILIAAVVLPPGSQVAPPKTEAAFVFALVGELVIGLLLGYAVLLVFTAVRSAGVLADLQIGLTAGSVFDPNTQSSQMPLESLANMLGILLFFASNAHHLVLMTLRELAKALPAGLWLTDAIGAGAALTLVSTMLEATVRLALPIIAITLIVDVALALASRMVPQLQPFFLATPIKTMLGFGLMVVGLPVWSLAVMALFESIPKQLGMLLVR